VIKTSIADAKAHLSELVDQAEHGQKRILILRNGRPAAAIVPVDVAGSRKAPKGMSGEDVRAFFDEAARYGDPTFAAVEELIHSRR
jgi:prevent-host-death family protein